MPGAWLRWVAPSSELSFTFLCIFIEVLCRRGESLLGFEYYRSKSDARLGIDPLSSTGAVLIPGYPELATVFLLASLHSEVALKSWHKIGAGPPSVVCNWTDRTAACALALSRSGTLFSCLAADLMCHTSTSHVVDVMSLLGSLKALLESYRRMHKAPLPDDVDAELMCRFLRGMLSCEHYVVLTFALRWLYDCLDFFGGALRAQLLAVLLERPAFERVFLHWEPSVRHLVHVTIIYRLFGPELVEPQRTYLGQLWNLAHSTEDEAPEGWEPPALPASHFPDTTTGAASHRASSSLAQTVQHYVAELVWSGEADDDSAPPTRWRSDYAAQNLRQLRSTLDEGIKWVADHRGRRKESAPFPPVSVALPPMQNMTSAFVDRSRPLPKPPGSLRDPKVQVAR